MRKELKPRERKFRPNLEWEGSELSDSELDAVLGVREKARADVRRNGDHTEMLLNGRPFVPRIYKSTQSPTPSYASEAFAQAMGDVLGRICANLEMAPEGKAVIGVFFGGGTDEQWLDQFDNGVKPWQMGDYSDVSRRRFKDFLKAKYGMVEKLNSADMDFFAVVPGCLREFCDPIRSAVFDGTMVRHGKLLVRELDLRSDDSNQFWGRWKEPFWQEVHSCGTFRRKSMHYVADAIIHGGIYHAYDMDGGRYNLILGNLRA